jgi:hypothetical protein
VKKGSWFREAGDFQRSRLVERWRLNPGFFSFYWGITFLEDAVAHLVIWVVTRPYFKTSF